MMTPNSMIRAAETRPSQLRFPKPLFSGLVQWDCLWEQCNLQTGPWGFNRSCSRVNCLHLPKSNNGGLIGTCSDQLVPSAGREARAGLPSPGRPTQGSGRDEGERALTCTAAARGTHYQDCGNFLSEMCVWVCSEAKFVVEYMSVSYVDLKACYYVQ